MEQELKVGDKVELPLVKAVGIAWRKSVVIQRAVAAKQSYLFVVDIQHDYAELSENDEAVLGERFLLTEIRPFTSSSPDTDIILTLRNSINEINAQKTL